MYGRVPNSTSSDGFFFEHDYTTKCQTAQTLSNRALNAFVGSAYFKYQQKLLEEGHFWLMYVKDDGNKCHFHAYVQNSKTLN